MEILCQFWSFLSQYNFPAGTCYYHEILWSLFSHLLLLHWSVSLQKFICLRRFTCDWLQGKFVRRKFFVPTLIAILELLLSLSLVNKSDPLVKVRTPNTHIIESWRVGQGVLSTEKELMANYTSTARWIFFFIDTRSPPTGLNLNVESSSSLHSSKWRFITNIAK